VASLISLDQAKIQLRLPIASTEYDDDLSLKVESATAIVVDYLNRSEDDWIVGSPAASPADYELPIVQAAILEVLANLWRHRGDEGTQDGPLTARVVNMLRGLRIPAIG
jgi:hypothetical protein